jgi:putative SOS response-associated peptidase YedK
MSREDVGPGLRRGGWSYRGGMCGRFTSMTSPAALGAYFHVDENVAEPLGERYNVAPTDEVYAVAEASGGERRLGTFRWGLIPFWSKDQRSGARMINARAESLLDKPAFRRSFERRRCIVPADGFYEWEAVPGAKRKQPWHFRRRDEGVLAFAGLWDAWRPRPDSDEGRIVSCTIVTTVANEVVRPLHDRMPVVLPDEAWDEWLDPANHDLDDLRALLVPAPDDLLARTPANPAVNDVRNDGPHLLSAAS